MVYAVAMDEMCEWPVSFECFPDDYKTADPETIRTAIDTATEILWALTGRIFGVCEREVTIQANMCRPCAPTLFRGEWYNIDPTSGACLAVFLPPPIFEVTRVVDAEGVELPFVATEYGADVLGNPAVVTYQRGLVPPRAAGWMVGRLASQRYFQCIGDTKRCELPSNTSSVTRQGVTVQMADVNEVTASGLTGLPDVDAWIRSVNPHGLTQPSEVIG